MIGGAVGAILGGLGAVGGVASIPFVGPLIAFLLSPVGRWVAVGGIVLAAYAYGFYKGDAHGDRQCADARLQMTIARQKVETAIAKAQAQQAKDVAAELEQLNKQAEGQISALQKQLKERPEIIRDVDCRVPGAGGVRDPKRPKR